MHLRKYKPQPHASTPRWDIIIKCAGGNHSYCPRSFYTHSFITVAHVNANRELILVDRTVLQGDPCSPLISNICFNPLMQTVIQLKYLHLSYKWDPNVDLWSTSRHQFADDTVFISDNIKSAQFFTQFECGMVRGGWDEDHDWQVFDVWNKETIDVANARNRN